MSVHAYFSANRCASVIQFHVAFMAPAVVRCDAVSVFAVGACGWHAGVVDECERGRARAGVDVSADAVDASQATYRQALVQIHVVLVLVAAYSFF